jgi:hypothetical protein
MFDTDSFDADFGRPPLDRVLGSRQAFKIDEMACAAAARIISELRGLGYVPNFALRRSLSHELLFRISLTAICHQINWDFISSKMGEVFDEIGDDAAFLANVTARQLEQWLAGYHRPDRIKAKERAALLRNVGAVVLRDYSGNTETILLKSKGRLYGEGSISTCLDSFDAFSADPLRKKTNVLIHEIVRDRIARFDDEEDIKPAIDYHIIRLYLRSGRVVPVHQEAFDALKHSTVPPTRFVKLIRQAVSEALSLTAFYARASIPMLNGLEWEIGRDICDRDHPLCNDPAATKAVRWAEEEMGCPYIEFCHAFKNPEWRMVSEPVLRKNFY